MNKKELLKKNIQYIKNDAASQYIYRRGQMLYLNGRIHLMSHSDHYFEFTVDDEYKDFKLKVDYIDTEWVTKCSCGSSNICSHRIGAYLQIIEDLSRENQKANVPGIRFTRQGMIDRVIKERREKAAKASYRLELAENAYGEHILFNEKNERYFITLHDVKKEKAYCSCPDFSKNKLGTCKHLMWTFNHLKKNPDLLKGRQNEFPFVEITCDPEHHNQISWFYPGRIPDPEISALIYDYFGSSMQLPDEKLSAFPAFLHRISSYKEVKIRPSVYRKVERFHNRKVLRSMQNNAGLDFGSFKVKLYPFQKEAVRFATFREGVLLADETGLGKSFQAIASAVFKKQFFDFKRCLLVCPASLMGQWKREFFSLTGEDAEILSGSAKQRADCYRNSEAWFFISNYERVLKDYELFNESAPDLMIIDEAQRIKNYESQTHERIRRIPRKHIIAISGTPVTHRLTDLYSIVSLVDNELLSPLWEFSYQHYYFDPERKNRITGYFDLDQVALRLKDVLLRREKKDVLDELPEITSVTVAANPTPVQMAWQRDFALKMKQIFSKKYLSPFDWQQLFQHIGKLRLLANDPFLLGIRDESNSKLNELKNILFEKLDVQNNSFKVLIFSEWIKMNYRIAQLLRENNVEFVELNGTVPVEKRQELFDAFEKNEQVKIFLSSETGGAGLNLQDASVVIHFDIPIEKNRMEQRLGRLNRIGQKRKKLLEIKLFSAASIEEKIIEGFHLNPSLISALTSENIEDEKSLTLSSDFIAFLRKIVDEFSSSEIIDEEDQLLQIKFEENNWEQYEVMLRERVNANDRGEEVNPEAEFAEETSSELNFLSAVKSPQKDALSAGNDEIEGIVRKAFELLNSMALLSERGKIFDEENMDVSFQNNSMIVSIPIRITKARDNTTE